MSFRPGNFSTGLAAGALLAIAPFCAHTQAADAEAGGTLAEAPANAAPAKNPLEFVPPSAPETKPNFPDRPQSLENLFNRTKPQIISPPQRIVPSHRSQQWIDEQNNWAFITPEDVIHDYMTKDIMKIPEYGPDGKEKASLSAVERFYERLSRTSAPTNSFRSGVFGLSDPTRNPRDTDSIPNLFGTPDARPVTGLPGLDGISRPNTLADLLGVKKNNSIPETLRARKEQQDQMDAFRKVLDFPQPDATAFALNPLLAPNSAGSYSAPVGTANPYAYGSDIGQIKPYDPTAALNAPVAPVAPIAPIWQGGPLGPGQANPATEIPTLSQTRVLPPKPDYSLPQRKF